MSDATAVHDMVFLRRALTINPDELATLMKIAAATRCDPALCMKFHHWAVAVDGAQTSLLLLQTARVTMDANGIEAGTKFIGMAIAKGGVNRKTAVQVIRLMKRDSSNVGTLRAIKSLTILYPNLWEMVSAVASATYESGDYERAIQWISHALSIKIGDAENYLRLGYIHEGMNNRSAALESYMKAVRITGIGGEAINFLSGWHARSGNTAEAIRLTYQRERALGKAITPSQFQTILLKDNQLEPFIRFDQHEIALGIHHLVSLGRIASNHRLTIACNSRLHAMVEKAFPNWCFVAADGFTDAPVVAHGALPHIIKELGATTRDAKPIRWPSSEARLKNHDVLTVGVTWRSSLRLNPKSFGANPQELRLDLLRQLSGDFDAQTSIWRKIVPLSAFQPIFDDPRLQLISIQYGVSEEEKRLLNDTFGDKFGFLDVDFAGNFSDIAAKVQELDAVVAIPNSHAHLAAALGVPTHVLMHETPVPVWATYPKDPVYQDVTLHLKPLRKGPDGRFFSHYSGDWSETINRVRQTILKDFGLS
jgi:tetratricopeptide (TPR) repeat protein